MRTIRFNNRFTVAVPDTVADWYAEHGQAWERARTMSLWENLGTRDVLFDVGAEKGWMLAPVAGRVAGTVLIEPLPELWPTIRQVWEANALPKPLATWCGFLDDATDLNPPRLRFDTGQTDGWPNPAWEGGEWPDTSFGLLGEHADTTPRSTLDDWCQARRLWPTALNIDVEGAELAVLTGATAALREPWLRVWVSIHPGYLAERHDASDGQVHDLMAAAGFVGVLLEVDHEEHWLFERAR